MKLTRSVTIAIATGTLLVGAGATAATAAPGERGAPDREAAVADRVAKLDCANADAAKARIEHRAAKATARIPKRVARLTEAKGKAEAAGRTKLAARIQKGIDRRNERLGKIAGFVEQLHQKIDEKCASDS